MPRQLSALILDLHPERLKQLVVWVDDTTIKTPHGKPVLDLVAGDTILVGGKEETIYGVRLYAAVGGERGTLVRSGREWVEDK